VKEVNIAGFTFKNNWAPVLIFRHPLAWSVDLGQQMHKQFKNLIAEPTRPFLSLTIS
jgi:hypothetical protein